MENENKIDANLESTKPNDGVGYNIFGIAVQLFVFIIFLLLIFPAMINSIFTPLHFTSYFYALFITSPIWFIVGRKICKNRKNKIELRYKKQNPTKNIEKIDILGFWQRILLRIWFLILSATIVAFFSFNAILDNTVTEEQTVPFIKQKI